MIPSQRKKSNSWCSGKCVKHSGNMIYFYLIFDQKLAVINICKGISILLRIRMVATKKCYFLLTITMKMLAEEV